MSFPIIPNSVLRFLLLAAPLAACTESTAEEQESDLSAGQVTQLAMSGDGSDFKGAMGCGLTTGKGLLCWGGLSFGGLGDGIHERFGSKYDVPVSPVGLGPDLRSLTAVMTYRGVRACVVDGGAVKCWGAEVDGRATLVSDGSKPITIPGLEQGFGQVSDNGEYGIYALKEDGSVFHYSVLDAINGARKPASKLTGFGEVARLTKNCALTKGGEIRCADRSGTVRSLTDLYQLGTNVRSFDTANKVLCAVNADDTLTCIDRETRQALPVPSDGVKDVVVGWGSICALMTDTGVKCWEAPSGTGAGHFELGRGRDADPSGFAYVSGFSRGVKAIAGGGRNYCLTTVSNQIACWGNWSAAGYGAPVPIPVGRRL